MGKHLSKKVLSLLLASSMVVGSASVMTGCGNKNSSGDGGSKDEPVTLDVFSQLANYSGMQGGWIADVLLEKFNVKLNIIPDPAGQSVYDTRAENGDLGDIVVFGNNYDKYPSAIQQGLLYDWNEDGLLEDFGPYINEHMQDALNNNRELTKTITEGASDKCYGMGHAVATSSENHAAFMYTWDIRWDLYKELGYPECKDLDDYLEILKDMQKICPKDEADKKTYAVSLWNQWDDAMVMYVKSMATAYYGYDEQGLGIYDPVTGDYYDALMDNGPYLEMLKFFNKLYQEGLVDPDSMTQTYDQAIEKIKNGGVFTSIFNYSGSLAYNTPAHLQDGKMMYCLKPEEASPLVYGLTTLGGDRIWTIGAKSDYPELAMEIINYLSTPEGYMVTQYGPKGETWDYDEEGNTYFTELGKKCNQDKMGTKMEKHEGTYHDGELQINNLTWALDAENPDSNGETYNCKDWKSELVEPETEIEKDWAEKTECITIDDYMEGGKYTVAPVSAYAKPEMDQELSTIWNQVTTAIKTGSWQAMYAKTDAEFDKIVDNMKKEAESYGYQQCLEWSQEEAAKRKACEDALATSSSSSSEAE